MEGEENVGLDADFDDYDALLGLNEEKKSSPGDKEGEKDEEKETPTLIVISKDFRPWIIW